ncbi:MAG: FecR domain-containing protein [Odoribacter splanchnicus]
MEEILEELGRWYDVKVIFRSARKKTSGSRAI